MRTALYGERHSKVAIACNNLGSLLQDRGRYEEAERQLLRAWKLRSELSGETHAETLKARFNRAANLWRWRGQPGLDEFAALMPLARESFGPRSRGLAQVPRRPLRGARRQGAGRALARPRER
ncbi:MAG: hypothetical protein CSA62_14785 [Planctomycetota bacterium]|nr:MAG: hypothetical protein CSA62_14785 [Planctomycetota bacterium]